MLPLAHAGLTTPAVAGPGCNEWLGVTASEQSVRSNAVRLWSFALNTADTLCMKVRGCTRTHHNQFLLQADFLQ